MDQIMMIMNTLSLNIILLITNVTLEPLLLYLIMSTINMTLDEYLQMKNQEGGGGISKP